MLSSEQQKIIETLNNQGIIVNVPEPLLEKQFNEVVKPFYNWYHVWMLVRSVKNFDAYIYKNGDIIAIQMTDISGRLVIPKQLKNIVFIVDEFNTNYKIAVEDLNSIKNKKDAIELFVYGVIEPSEKIMTQMEQFLINELKHIIDLKTQKNKLGAWRVSHITRIADIYAAHIRICNKPYLSRAVQQLHEKLVKMDMCAIGEDGEISDLEFQKTNSSKIVKSYTGYRLTQQDFIILLNDIQAIQTELNKQ